MWSWVHRGSVHSGCPAGLWARSLGLPSRVGFTSGGFRVVMFGIVLPASWASAVADRTGLTAVDITDMHLQRFDGSVLDLRGLDFADERTLVPVMNREWMLAHSSRACPQCLRENPGVWPLWWRLSCAACCPKHALLLIDACPSCGIALTRGYRGVPRGLSDVRIQDPEACGNQTPDGPCTQLLGAMPTVSVGPGLVRAQGLVLRVAAGGPTIPEHASTSSMSVRLAGRDVSAAVWFAAFRDIAALTLAAQSPGQAAGLRPDGAASPPPQLAAALYAEATRNRDSLGSAHGYRTAPRTAALAGALLWSAYPALDAPDADAFAIALKSLALSYEDAVRRRRHDLLRAKPPTGLVAAAIAGHRTPLTGRVAAHATRRSRARDIARRTERKGAQARDDGSPNGGAVDLLRFIPELVPEPQYSEMVVGHLPGTAPTTGRRFAALSAARLAGAPSWAAAGAVLGIDRRASIQTADMVTRRILDPLKFWDSIERVLDDLIDQQIDYRARVVALANFIEVPKDRWRALCEGHPFAPTPARGRHGATWAWTTLVSGDHRHAPAALAPWARPALGTSREDGYRRFVRTAPRPVMSELLTWVAREHGLASHLDDHLRWKPPADRWQTPRLQ